MEIEQEYFYEFNYEVEFNDKEFENISLYEKHMGESNQITADAFKNYSNILKNIL